MMKIILNIIGKISKMPLWAIVIVSQVFIVLFIAFSPIKPKPYGDPDFYPEGRQLSLMIKGVEFEEPLIIDKAPLPSILYSIPFLFVSGEESNYQTAAVIFNVLTLLIGVFFFIKGVQIFAGKKTSILALLLVCLFPMHVYYSFGINAEVYAFTFVALTFFYFVRYFKSYRYKDLILAFLFILLLLFTRPNAILIVPLFTLISSIFWFKSKKRSEFRIGILSIICFILFQGIMTIVSAIQKDVNKGLAQDTYLLRIVNQGFYQFRDEPFDWRYWQNTHREGSVDYQNWRNSIKEFKEIKRSDVISMGFIFDHFYWQDFKERPIKKIRQIVIKAVYGQFFIINSRPMKFYAKISKSGLPEFLLIHALINFINIIVLIYSILFVKKMSKNNLLNWVLLAIWVGILIFPSLVYMEPRYLFPSRIILVFMTSTYLIQRVRKNNNIEDVLAETLL